MATSSVKAREAKRQRLTTQHAKKRQALKEAAQKSYAANEIPWDVLAKMQKIPANASPVRQQQRCRLCGRPRGVYRKFGLCRVHLREFAMRGLVPGLHKASW